MGMIDIQKLNAEVEQMIASQQKEIEAYKSAALVAREEKFYKFISDMAKYSADAKTISGVGSIFVGSYDDGYGSMRGYDVNFRKRNGRIVFSYSTTLGDTYDHFSVGYAANYKEVIGGHARIIDNIVDWYINNPDVFRQRFEEACIKAIKAKAEKANAAYAAAKGEYERATHSNQ
jgi:hypothetical protein